jgi:hypothetical protein
MGSELPATAQRQIDVRVEAQDSIHMIELLRNGEVIERSFPEDTADARPRLPGRAKCRLRYGWGPWAALDLGRTCQWEMTVRIEGGRFLRAIPCYQSGPYEEEMRDRMRMISEREIQVQSFTSRVKCYGEDPTKSIIMELEGGSDAVLSVSLQKPIEQQVQSTLGDLRDENVVTFTGVFTSESYILERLVGPTEYSATIRWNDRRPRSSEADWYYVRVTQHNGQQAWSSPIWVG